MVNLAALHFTFIVFTLIFVLVDLVTSFGLERERTNLT